MTFRKQDDAIPTLTEQVPTGDDGWRPKEARFLTRVQSNKGTMPAWPGSGDVPTLTTTVASPPVIQPSVARAPVTNHTTRAISMESARLREQTPSPDMADVVLAGALQADIEEAVQDALDEAMHLVKMRLEARIPALVSQAIRRTRAG